MYGGKNVRNNQPDLQAHWFIANYVVAAVDESERADQAIEACGTLVSMLMICSTCLLMRQPGK
jgi:hypothetical protein